MSLYLTLEAKLVLIHLSLHSYNPYGDITGTESINRICLIYNRMQNSAQYLFLCRPFLLKNEQIAKAVYI